MLTCCPLEEEHAEISDDEIEMNNIEAKFAIEDELKPAWLINKLRLRT